MRQSNPVVCACSVWLLAMCSCQSNPAAMNAEYAAKRQAAGSQASKAGERSAVPDLSSEVSAGTHLAAGKFHESQNQIDAAIEQYQTAVRLDPRLAEARNRVGVLLTRQSRYEQAEAHLQEAARLAPQKAHVHNNLAFCFLSQQRWQDAEAELRNALEINPKFVRARINLGLVLAQQKKFHEAEAAFHAVLSDGDVAYNMGIMYQSLGHYVDAATAYRNALALNPRLEAARNRLVVVEPKAREEQERRSKNPPVASAEVAPLEGEAVAAESSEVDSLPRAEASPAETATPTPAQAAVNLPPLFGPALLEQLEALVAVSIAAFDDDENAGVEEGLFHVEERWLCSLDPLRYCARWICDDEPVASLSREYADLIDTESEIWEEVQASPASDETVASALDEGPMPGLVYECRLGFPRD